MDDSDRAPLASSAAVAARMSCHPRRDTVPELAVRRRLHALGLRYRVDSRPLPGLRRKADIVFGGAKVAVFIDGCFWHGCPDHGVQPKSNTAWWLSKISRTQQRDLETTKLLREAGWVVVRAWAHEDAAEVVRVVAELVGQVRR